MGMLAMQATIELDYPIHVDGVETRTLTMRRPKVGDQMRHADAEGDLNPESTAKMYADLMMIKYDDILELDLVDYRKVSDAYNTFFPQDLTEPEQNPPGTSSES